MVRKTETLFASELFPLKIELLEKSYIDFTYHTGEMETRKTND